MGVLPASMSVTGFFHGQQRASNPLELRLEMVVSYPVSAQN